MWSPRSKRLLELVLLAVVFVPCACSANRAGQQIVDEVSPLATLRIGNDLAVQQTSDGQVRLLFPACEPQRVSRVELSLYGGKVFWLIEQGNGSTLVDDLIAGQTPPGLAETVPYVASAPDDQVFVTVVSVSGPLYGAAYKASDLSDRKVHFKGGVFSEGDFVQRFRCGRLLNSAKAGPAGSPAPIPTSAR